MYSLQGHPRAAATGAALQKKVQRGGGCGARGTWPSALPPRGGGERLRGLWAARGGVGGGGGERPARWPAVGVSLTCWPRADPPRAAPGMEAVSSLHPIYHCGAARYVGGRPIPAHPAGANPRPRRGRPGVTHQGRIGGGVWRCRRLRRGRWRWRGGKRQSVAGGGGGRVRWPGEAVGAAAPRRLLPAVATLGPVCCERSGCTGCRGAGQAGGPSWRWPGHPQAGPQPRRARAKRGWCGDRRAPLAARAWRSLREPPQGGPPAAAGRRSRRANAIPAGGARCATPARRGHRARGGFMGLARAP